MRSNVAFHRFPPQRTVDRTAVHSSSNSPASRSETFIRKRRNNHGETQRGGGEIARDVAGISAPSFAESEAVEPAKPSRVINSVIATSAKMFSGLVMRKAHCTKLFREIDPLNEHKLTAYIMSCLTCFG